MKTFAEFMSDEKQKKNRYHDFWDMTSAFLIPREQMPQIKIDDFLYRINQIGIEWVKEKGVPKNFRPTQINFDSRKVQEILDSLKTSGFDKNSPIVVSNDMYVLDGHHRYIASILANRPVDVLAVDLPINKLLKLAMDIYNE